MVAFIVAVLRRHWYCNRLESIPSTSSNSQLMRLSILKELVSPSSKLISKSRFLSYLMTAALDLCYSFLRRKLESERFEYCIAATFGRRHYMSFIRRSEENTSMQCTSIPHISSMPLTICELIQVRNMPSRIKKM